MSTTAINAIFGADNGKFVDVLGDMEKENKRVAKAMAEDVAWLTAQTEAESAKKIAIQNAEFAAIFAANAEKKRISAEAEAATQAAVAATTAKRQQDLALLRAIVLEERNRIQNPDSHMGSGVSPGFAKLMATEAAIDLPQAGAAAGKGFAGKFFSNLQSHGSGGIAQLVHVFRATFDSLASGMDPRRVILQQAPQAIQAITSMSSGLVEMLSALAAPLLAIGGIIGGIMIYAHRVKGIIADLTDSVQRVFYSDKIPAYLLGVNEIAQVQKKISDEIERQTRNYNSVLEVSNRQLQITKEQYEFQRKIMELQGSPKAAITALNKAERDDEVKNAKVRSEMLGKESEAKLAEAESFRVEKKIQSQAEEARTLGQLTKAREKAAEYFGGDDPAGQVAGSKAETDAKEIRELKETRARMAIRSAESLSSGDAMSTSGVHTLSKKDAEILSAKEKLLAEHVKSIKALQDFNAAEGDRKRNREKLDAIDAEATAAAKEKNKLDLDLDPSNATGMLARNRIKDRQDAKEAQQEARNKRDSGFQDSLQSMTKGKKMAALGAEIGRHELRRDLYLQSDSSGGGSAAAAEAEKILKLKNQLGAETKVNDQAKGYALNSQQRMGAYAATPPDFKRLADAAIQTAHNTANLRPKPTGVAPNSLKHGPVTHGK